MAEIILSEVSHSDPQLRTLIGLLDEELLTRYPKSGIHGLDFDDPQIAAVRFFLITVEGEPAACGAFRPLDQRSAEIKRMFVRKEYRKQGLAGRILSAIESAAMQADYRILRLETGPNQPESLHLYRKFGFDEIEPWGEYIGDPYSICFEKQLAPSLDVKKPS